MNRGLIREGARREGKKGCEGRRNGGKRGAVRGGVKQARKERRQTRAERQM